MRWPVAGLVAVGMVASVWSALGAVPAQMSVSEALARAIAFDEDLCTARADLEMAELELQAAEESSFLPSIGLGVNAPQLSGDGWTSEIEALLNVEWSVPWLPGRGLSASLGLDFDARSYDLIDMTWQVSLSETLDLAGLDDGLAPIESRQRAVDTAEDKVADALSGVIQAVIGDYAEILALRLQTEIDTAAWNLATEDRAATETTAAEGYASEADIVDARIRALEAEIRAEKSHQAYDDALRTFSIERLGLSDLFEPVAINLEIDRLLEVCKALLATAEMTDAILEQDDGVQTARTRLEDARETLAEKRAAVLPELAVSASMGADQWRVGFGLSFDLFDPDRSTQVELAELKLQAAQGSFDVAWREAEARVLDAARRLQYAIDDLGVLDLEGEKWAFQEERMAARIEAGLASVSEWDEFADELRSFRVESVTREVSLLTTFLAYQEALNMKLAWEEWL